MSFIKNKILQYICLFLLIYSLIGGLLVPLSPNIERLSYKESDSSLSISIYTPKISEKVDNIYLKAASLKDTSQAILFPESVKKLSDGFELDFKHPKMYSNFKKGDVLDLVCHTETWGALRYFSAFYLDTVLGQNTLLKVKNLSIPQKEFHLSFPNRPILRESIRNLFYHVPMWFTMMFLLAYSLIHSIMYLANGYKKNDLNASTGAGIGLFFGILGVLTGMIWAQYTWGAFWTNDPKLNGAAIGTLAYLAYFVLRGSVEYEIKRAKLSAVYNIFAFTIFMVFIMVLPRLNDSLHPGNGGNPGFNIYEQDNVMRLFFYPAVIGWAMLGFWLSEICSKLKD